MLRILLSLLILSTALGLPPHGRIFGGDPAAPGQFPFIVSLNNPEQFCDGSIINKNWVVTAGHCIVAMTPDTTVLVGTNDEQSGGISYEISSYLYHPDFDQSTLQNDIGLIRIEGEFQFGDYVQAVDFTEPEVNASCFAAGWGITDSLEFPNILQFVELTALSLEDCKRIAGDLANESYLGEEQICGLGPEGMGACYGDSGGPFVCDGKLAGVVSYGIVPCAQGFPDVYTRPSKYVDWINEVINKNV